MDRGQRRSLVNTVLNRGGSIEGGEFLDQMNNC
jgi:hypothetical protein